MKRNIKTAIMAVIPLLVAALSLFVITKYASSTEFHAESIDFLDEKQTTVAELTAASTAASTAISLIPGDAGTPIANKLADFSSYFLVVFSAIFLEKYLLTVTGFAAFKLLIPAGCVLLSAYAIWKKDALRRLAEKLILFGLAIVLIIPVSVKVSRMIETTYKDSIEETIETAKDASDEVESSTEEQETGIIGSVISGVKKATTGMVEKAQKVLDNFVEALAVMLVTSCVIPVLVILAFIWLSKIILGADIQTPRVFRRRMPPHREEETTEKTDKTDGE